MANQNEQSIESTTVSNEELETVAGGAAPVQKVQLKEIALPEIDTGAIENLRERVGGGPGGLAEDTKGYAVF